MNAAGPVHSAKLYSPRLLALSTQLAAFPLTGEFAHRGAGRSRTCGSTIDIGIDIAPDGRVERVGCSVTACAVGQSSAAIFAQGAIGQTVTDIQNVAASIEPWLCATRARPDWPDLDALDPAVAHPGRHGALLMAWNAASHALSSFAPAR